MGATGALALRAVGALLGQLMCADVASDSGRAMLVFEAKGDATLL